MLALVSIFGTRSNANPLALTVAQQTVLAGLNPGNPEPQRAESTPVGTIPGSVRVDDRGAAKVSLPIELPPAARGMQPRLALEYDSQLGNGPLGVGWRLGGQSAITRCGHTLADDGEVAGVRMTDADGLCLDGERLMLTEGTHFEVGAVYRPKRDDFSRVELIAGADATVDDCHGGFGVEVRRRDGTIAIYGCQRDASVSTHLGVHTWALSQVRDRFGNTIDYHYNYATEPVVDADEQILGEADVDHTLTAIDYGGHVDLHPSTRHVRLEWEDRPDPWSGYFVGAPQRQSKRLHRISTFGPDGGVYRYELDYDTPSITARSLLHAVRQCDMKGVCRPDTTFEWELGELAVDSVDDDANFNNRAAWPFMAWQGDWQAYDPAAINQTVLDANGDGRTDMFLAVGAGGQSPPANRGWELWTSQPGASAPSGIMCGTAMNNFDACAQNGRYVVHESARTGILASPSFDDPGPATPALFATDYDGDGRDDVIALGDNHLFEGGLPPAGRVFYIAQTQPEGGVEQFEFDPEVQTIWWFTAADQTGDGLGDLLFCGGKSLAGQAGTGSWFFIPNTPGEGFDASNRIDTGLACSVYDKFLHLDHDGDGLTSLLVIPVWDTDGKHWIGSKQWSNYHALRLDPLAGWAASLEDTGLPPDLAQRWRPSIAGNFNAAFASDDFPRSQQGFGLDKVIDINGDGLDDILRYELEIGDTAEQLGVIMQTIASLSPSWEEWGGIRMWINTGAGFRDGGWFMKSDQPGDFFFRRFTVAGVLDFDGDGRLDYLTPIDDPQSYDWSWSIFTSNGDGSFVEHINVIHAPFDDSTFSARVMGAFDLDGDGLHDPGILHGSGWTLWEHAGAMPDKIVAVQDGLGARSELHYRALTDFEAPDELFEIDADACIYPERCERNPRVVVDRHFVDTGITGQPREFEHRYGVARSDREGGRGLGFERHEVLEWADVDGKSEPVYRHAVFYDHSYDAQLHDFPFAGRPRKTVDDWRDPETGRHRVIVDGSDYQYVQTTPQTYHAYVAQRVARVHELPSCGDVFCDTFLDLDETNLVTGTTDTVFEVDAYANPTVHTSSADTGSSTLTYHYETTYQNDPDAWLLGLPTHQRVVYLEPTIAQRDRETSAVYSPDTGALKTRITEPADIDLFLHESFSYDEHGNVISRTATDADVVIRKSTIGFDEHGVFPVVSTNALGHTSKMRWDPGLGVAIAAADPNDLRVVADYDGLGQLTGIRHFAGQLPRGDETTVTYETLLPNGDGPVLAIRAETDGHGYVVSEFDRLGRAVVERELGLDAVERYVAREYDTRGRLAAASIPAPLGQAPAGWEQLAYDFADRPIRRTLPDGTTESWAYYGTTTEHVDIGGTVSRLRRDTASRLVESVRGLGTPDEERLCFDYGAFELLERVRPDCIGREPLDISAGEAPPTIKSFVYDDLGQLVASHDPSEGPRSYFYNGHGELDALVDGNGNEVSLIRDALGRVTERHDVDGQTTWIWDSAFLGELAASQSPSGHDELIHYDAFGRVDELLEVIAGDEFDLTFKYDEYDRLAEIHYPVADELPAFWIRNVYAQNGQLRAVRSGPDDSLIWQAESLSDEGLLTAERFGEHTLTQRDYDPLRGFVRSIETTSSLGGTLQDLDYDWNADGTLDRRRDLIHDQAEVMDYDALHRVTEVTTSSGESSHERYFAYDSLGNLVYATDRGEYDYDAAGRLAVADGNTYDWDQNGNLLTRSGADPATLSYTAFDKIAELETDAGVTVFEYDASQDRIYRYSSADGRETVYVGDLYQRHVEDESGETQHHYYVPGLERIVANVVDTVDPISAERSIHYIHVDHLGSTDVVSDAAGIVEQRMSYDVWGKRRDPEDWTLPDEFAELGPVNLGYTGHEAQEDGGLINMGGRMYDPHLGRMASADPMVVDPTSTQGWNRFAYVLNRPLALTDPSGFSPAPNDSSDSEAASSGEDTDWGHAEGVIGKGEAIQKPVDSRRDGGSSQPKKSGEPSPEASPEAEQRAGDKGPGAGDQPSGPGDELPSPTPFHEDVRGVVQYIFRPIPNVIERGSAALIENRGETNESQERRRKAAADEAGATVIDGFQNPPAYVQISIEMTLILVGGDVELAGELIEGGVKILTRKGVKEGAEVAVESAAKKAAKKGASGGPRATKPHTQAAKRISREQSSGSCPRCGTTMTEPTQRVKGSTVNPAEAQGDHIYPRSKGGDGATVNDMRNIETICATCNRQKGATVEP